MRSFVFPFLFSCFLITCFSPGCKRGGGQETLQNIQADSIVYADVETNPVSAQSDDDAADDPAVWVHPADPARSMIVGTNKKSGIMMYNLEGEEIHFYPVGDANNVDVRYAFAFGSGKKGDIVACSERIHNKIVVFRVNPEDGSLVEISGDRFMSDIPEVYGFCLYRSKQTGKFYAFMNGKSGIIEQWELSPFGEGEITGQVVRTFHVATQPEGMVADDELGYLYVGEEDRGIWKFRAEPDSVDAPVFIAGSDTGNAKIQYDIEGLALYYARDSKGYLIASSQGNNSYAIFERGGENRYLGSFEVGSNGIDGVAETDGIDVNNQNLGGPFTKGLFVTQDGFNTDGETDLPQNFKLVAWEKIATLFDPPLLIDSTYNSNSQ